MFKNAFLGGFLASILSDKCRDVSEWAEKYRFLPASGSPEPGKWKSSRVPYAVDIMKALSINTDTKKVVFMKGTQLAGTEIILNFQGYIMSAQPVTMMVMMPTVNICSRFSKQRLQPMIDCTPELRKVIRYNREKDSGNTILVKEYDGGFMFLVGSNSPADSRSTPAGAVTADEIDAFPVDMGGEGDWLGLIDKRMSNFRNSKILLVSTPTVKDISRIEFEFNLGDKSYFYVPCPSCGEKQIIQWENFDYDEEDIDSIRLKCIACDHLIEEDQKDFMLDNGEWRATCVPKEKGCRSFHLSSLYSPYGWRSWAECLQEFLQAKNSPIKMKTFVNTVLGETYEESATEVSHEIIMKRAETYKCQVPDGVLVLVSGTDIQRDRLETSVYGYGLGEEAWHIEHRVFYGDPARRDVWEDLEIFLMQTFIGENGRKFKIKCSCIDTAGGFEKQAYAFVKPREKFRIFGIKGSSQNGNPLVNNPTKKSKAKIKLFTIGTATGKNTLYSYLNVTTPGPCYIHFPKGLTEEFYLQLTAEKIITKYRNGFPYQEWHKKRARNETLDCWVYAYSALGILNPNFVAIYEKMYGPQVDSEKEPPKKLNRVKKTGKFKRQVK